MKKLARKLFLSCAALAACATTLVSTTFAWYTSNSEVDIDGVDASTASSGDSLLLISETGAEGSWGSSITITAATANGIELAPVAKTGNNTYKSWAGDSNALSDSDGSASTIRFTIYFKASSALPVYVKSIDITNAQASNLPAKDILANAGGLVATEQNKTYTADVRRTLCMETITTSYSAGTPATSTYANHKLAGLVESYSDSLASLGSSYNAHAYYNAVKTLTGNDAISTTGDGPATGLSETSSQTKFTVGTTPTPTNAGDATYLKVDFVIYVNGWDKAAFDAIQGQSITVSIGFTSNADSSDMIYVS